MLYGTQEKLSLREYLLKKPMWLWLVIGLLMALGLGYGAFGVYQLVSTNDQEIVSSNDVESQVCEEKPDFGQITVYISGAVSNPGVYILESGDRIVDLLKAAGGISANADKIYVNRQFNLAKQLSDGEQLYIPTTTEVESKIELENSVAVLAQKNDGGQVAGASQNSPISINSSPKSKLMELSGIGEARATKIIDNRPYNSLQELVEKSVISQSLLDDIQSQIGL
jgi:competence protein ComEA